jgi:hypothetical protein
MASKLHNLTLQQSWDTLTHTKAPTFQQLALSDLVDIVHFFNEYKDTYYVYTGKKILICAYVTNVYKDDVDVHLLLKLCNTKLRPKASGEVDDRESYVSIEQKSSYFDNICHYFTDEDYRLLMNECIPFVKYCATLIGSNRAT